MVKHTQAIRRQFACELFECIWPFCEVGTYRAKQWYYVFTILNEIWSKLLLSFLPYSL